MLLEGAGFEIIDLGTDVAPEKFVQVYKMSQPRCGLLYLALLDHDYAKYEATIEALE